MSAGHTCDLHHLRVDVDTDNILTYSDQALWTIPDPSFFNYTSNGSPWLRGTYHNTMSTMIGLCYLCVIEPAYGAYWQVVLDQVASMTPPCGLLHPSDPIFRLALQI